MERRVNEEPTSAVGSRTSPVISVSLLAGPSLGAGGQLAGVGSLNLYASTGQWRLVSPIPGPDERLVEGVSSHPLAVSAQAEERWTGEVSSMLP
jgi:hypothetical protein